LDIIAAINTIVLPRMAECCSMRLDPEFLDPEGRPQEKFLLIQTLWKRLHDHSRSHRIAHRSAHAHRHMIAQHVVGARLAHHANAPLPLLLNAAPTMALSEYILSASRSDQRAFDHLIATPSSCRASFDRSSSSFIVRA
jgi:hypothetical protein